MSSVGESHELVAATAECLDDVVTCDVDGPMDAIFVSHFRMVWLVYLVVQNMVAFK